MVALLISIQDNDSPMGRNPAIGRGPMRARLGLASLRGRGALPQGRGGWRGEQCCSTLRNRTDMRRNMYRSDLRLDSHRQIQERADLIRDGAYT